MDRASAERAVLIRAGLGVLEVRASASRRGLAPRRANVVDAEGDVMDAVAMAVDVVRDLAVG